MTSEGTHHPGQQPDEVSPGAGGPAPYGDRPAPQDHRYGADAPDLGWAPPPPPGRPNPPAWGAQGEQQPTPAWATQAPQQSDPPQPGHWGPPAGSPQPSWSGEQGQGAPAWGAAAPQSPHAASEQPQAAAQQPHAAAEQPGWGPAEQAAPTWAQPEPAARGAARVPQSPAPQAAPAAQPWPGQDDPARSGGWNTESPQDPANGWAPAQQQQDDPNRSGGWNGAEQQQGEQPGWAPAEQAAPAWSPPEPAARGAARVPQPEPAPPATSAAQPWPGQDDPNRSGGWNGAEQQQGEQPGWDAAPPPAATPPGRASVPVPGDGAPTPWGAGPENPPQWAGNAAERPAVPDVQPWSANEAWGHAEAGEPAPSQAASRFEPEQAGQPPMYQPAPGPGISSANAVPLPPQEQRVPGASLAAAPPVDYAPPAQFTPQDQFAPEQPGRDAGLPSYEQEQPGWAQAGSRHDEPQQQSAAPVIPAPRVSPEAGALSPEGADPAAGSISASASVPLASRVMPPTDQALRPAGTAAPQPRVYGRPARPEAADEPEQGGPSEHQPDHAPASRFDQGPEQRFGQGFDQEPRFGQAPADQEPHFGQAPENRFGQTPDNRFDQETHFGRAPDNGFGQEPRFGQAPPDNRFDQEPRFGQAPENRSDQGPEARFDEWDRAPGGTAAFGAAPVAPASPAAPPAFPPGVPSFIDPPSSDRPVNGVRPPSGTDRPADPFGTPAASGAAPGYGSATTTEHSPGGAFPPPQQSGPSWGQGGSEQEQNRFDSFKPAEEPPKAAEPPTPKVRNGRVLAAVLVAAVLILAVPLGLLMLLGKVSGDDPAPAFDPAVGSCVKKSGDGAAAANCGEAGAFTVVSRVDAKEKCTDLTQPHVVLQGDGANRVLCLKPAGQ